MIFIHAFFILMSLSMVVPFLLIIAVSLSRESDLYDFGYRLIPKKH
jgi:putative aldouronate transport system permease protein